MSTPCKLYVVTFETSFEVTFAAPVDMSSADFQKLVISKKEEVVREIDPVHDFKAIFQPPIKGTSDDTYRETWIVNDTRDDFVIGEETSWLPEAE